MFYYGAHVSVDLNNIINSIKEVENIGGNICQIFLTKPLHKGVSEISDKQLSTVKKYLTQKNLKLVIHSSYMLNFARIPLGLSRSIFVAHKKSYSLDKIYTLERNKNKISWWVQNLIDEMKYASKMGAIGCVIHLGKHLELTKKMAMENMLESLIFVIDNTPNNVKLIIETSSGQGTELCYELEDFKYFYEMFQPKYRKRIGICIDSCHVFAAGYDLRTKENVHDFFKKFNSLINIKNVILVQLNDSKKELGSRIDRHDSIGYGKIGLTGLSEFIKACYKLKIPIVLETPTNNYKKEIDLIKKIISPSNYSEK